MTSEKAQLRRRLREARRNLSASAQGAAQSAVAAKIATMVDPPALSVVAAYVATDGELSPAPTIELLRGAGVQIAYPRIADDRMTFHVVDDDTTLVAGEWGLTEPAQDAIEIDPADLDVVLTPLVAFDASCNRMGRGKGYYDQAFAFLGPDPRTRSGGPTLLGLAHDLQYVTQLDIEGHDVPLDVVVTPSAVHRSVRA